MLSNMAKTRETSEVGYDEVLDSVIFGTPDAVVERIREFQDALGLTGVSLDINPGGQIPYDRVVNSLRLLGEQVIPRFR